MLLAISDSSSPVIVSLRSFGLLLGGVMNVGIFYANNVAEGGIGGRIEDLSGTMIEFIDRAGESVAGKTLEPGRISET